MRIGLMAGGGPFPELFLKKALEKGYKIFVVAYTNEADEVLKEYADSIEWLRLGQFSRVLKFFKKNNIDEAVMLGTIKKTRLFSDIRPDFKALAFFARLKHTHDDSVLTLFANLLGKEGITIKPSTFLLPELINKKGCWTKRKPSKSEMQDILAGWPIAKQIGKYDIGQCVVISNGTILAVEAIDGTDATILRGGGLADKETVVVKISKPNQDLRFDLPCTGCDTIETMYKAGASTLILEAEKSISFDREKMILLAEKYSICIQAMDDSDFV
ncbi:MAG: UDP-2,3-diacylglucosamine diphosphatase LpxI [Desulfobacteraceae bacterium]|nr:UDP-2,3-diacylglucosamine diphosphatase LpxI [Desulfobacteraceae bacterium]